MDNLVYAGVIVDVRAQAVDRLFQYTIPQDLQGQIQVGHRVLVPFGPRKVEGYVVEIGSELAIDSSRLKAIIKPLDPTPVILPSLLELALWAHRQYAGLLSEAIQYMLPPGYRYGKERVGVKKQQLVTLVDFNPQLRANASAQKRVVQVLQSSPRILASDLIAQADVTYSTLQSLEKLGIIAINAATIERNIAWDQVPDPPLSLTLEQTKACETIRAEIKAEKRPILIHGVTGSGKTEIYLRIIEEVIAQGKQAIVLVPEIALTSQTLSRFGSRFQERVTVLHSALSLGERFDQWWKIYRGEVDVVIGARSAVFAPTPNLGLIVLDEEHEGTYKQEEGSIRYHTREMAIKRCELVEGQVLLGSATPALESYHHALQGNYALVQLTQRVESRSLPKVKVVDMREQFELGNRSMFSYPLHEALEALAVSKDQAIILLNRRGYASFVLCRECGHVLECPNCQVSLTYHKGDNRLHCHYCVYKTSLPKLCPKCASRYFRQFGVGTEQVQATLNKEFPELKTLRLDADTTRRKGSHGKILREFSQGKAQVLIGTQMVAKGLDFPNVTLVGVLSADLGLNFPDLRAAERTFQLLTQVAGRSGRGEKPGQVIVQAYDPDHFAIKCAQNHDYFGFYRQEISFRRNLKYPPFNHLTRILCTGPKEATEQHILVLHQELLDLGLAKEDLYGPAPAPIGRIQGRFRWQVLIKTINHPGELVSSLSKSTGDVQVVVDIDPMFML